MLKRTKSTTTAAKISDVIRWADRQGFHNIAGELRGALALLPVPEPPTARTKSRA
jgi:hypothetical protein